VHHFILIPIIALFAMIPSCTQEKFNVVEKMHVYTIQKHNDSLYFSTLDSGIFSFSPDNPGRLTRVAKRGALPLRSIAFSSKGICYAATYQSGVHRVSGDTLAPLAKFYWPAWSIKIDQQDNIWLAGIHGIFRQQSDSLVFFNKRGEVHDIAFYHNELAVAHKNGITIFNKETGALLREFCKGVLCWTMTNYDSLFVGGGLNTCVVINKDRCTTITFGPKGNIVWSTAMDDSGSIYLATQKGLYRARRGGAIAHCVGFKGICIKSLAFDNKGRLWVGRFAANIR
jgi:hypothetical protein